VRLLASNPLQPLIDVFESILKFFHDSLGIPWGWAIITLTILVRALLLPLTFKQFHSMQKLAHLQPEMKKLQERFKNDKERLNQEMMKFYKENKVNPFASCLPMVAQFPVFISLYYMLRVDLRRDICPEINGIVDGVKSPHYSTPIPCGSSGESTWLFIHDLTDKATGITLVILIILYVGSQLFSTLLMSTTTDRSQRLIFMALPFVFVTFVIRFPAGLLVYWITTNIWTIVQQSIIRKRLGPLRPPGADTGGGLLAAFGGGGGGGSGGTKTAAAPSGNGKKAPAEAKQPKATSKPREPVSAEPKGKPAGPPPRPPGKKKKRSGRRR
jgi:YidC/Oxa1 family membrane protein insertase